MKNCKFLWWIISELAFSFFVISDILQPWLFGHRPKNGKSKMKFWEIWCQRFFLTITISVSHNWERTDQRAHIRGRIVSDSQHQIVFQLNFYFYARPRIDLQKSERMFLLTLKTPACPWKSGISSPKFGQNPTILGKILQHWAKLPPGRGPQIRNDISPPALLLCSMSNFKSEKWIFFAKDFRRFPCFLPASNGCIACSSWKILCSNRLFGCLLILYFVGHIWIHFVCTNQPHLFNSHHLLHNGSSVMKTFWKTSEYF